MSRIVWWLDRQDQKWLLAGAGHGVAVALGVSAVRDKPQLFAQSYRNASLVSHITS